MRLRRSILFLVSVAVTACSGVLPTTYTAADLPDPAEFTEEWGCGYGFWLGNPDQTAALRFAYRGDGPPEAEVDLPSADWRVTLIEGTDLYANWCDDVIEAGEPTPVEHRVIEVVGGHLSIVGAPPPPFEGGTMELRAVDLVVELPDGRDARLGNVTAVNPSWGFLAG
jgi:hypothetical protein